MRNPTAQTHVVMVTNVIAPDKLGGLERYVRELAHGLAARGVHVSVVSKATTTKFDPVERAADGVTIHRYAVPRKDDSLFALKYPSFTMRGVRRAITVISKADARFIIHGHFPVPMLSLLHKHRRQYVYTCHAPVYRELRSERQGTYRMSRVEEQLAVAGLRTLERQVVRRAARVITLSKFIRDEVARLDSAAARKTTLIPGGIDLDRFSPAPHTPPPRQLPRKGPIFFTARRMVERTGVEELVRAFSFVAASHPDATLVIAGAGPRRAAVDALVAATGLEDQIQILGFISDAELVEWYRAADIAVTPTQALEGFGLSTAEAMACGAVPLVTAVGANAEVVEGLPSLLISPSGAVPDLARSLMAIMARIPEIRRVYGTEAQRRALRFGWPTVVDQHIDLYERLLVSRSS